MIGDRIGKACKGAIHGVENLTEQRRGEEIRPAAIGQIIEETIHRGRCATILGLGHDPRRDEAEITLRLSLIAGERGLGTRQSGLRLEVSCRDRPVVLSLSLRLFADDLSDPERLRGGHIRIGQSDLVGGTRLSQRRRSRGICRCPALTKH